MTATPPPPLGTDGRDSSPGPARTWLWVLGGLVVVLAIALVVVLVTRDSGSDAASTTTTTTAAPATTTTTSAATTTTSAPTTTVPLPAITDDPQTYAQYLFAAWQNGNQTDAANVASSQAVSQMFAQAYPAKGPYSFANCDPAAGSLYCTWNGQNGATLVMTVRTLTGGLPIQVEMVQFSG